MGAIIEAVSRFLFVIIGLILLSAATGLFIGGLNLSFDLYMENLFLIVKSLIFVEHLTVNGPTGYEYSIFTSFWDYYSYSMVIFLSSLIMSIAIGIVLTYVALMLPDKGRKIVTRIASLLESLPDLFIIMVIQFVVIFYYKQTGHLLFPIAGTGNNKAYFLPICALALIPTFMIFKIILYLANEEMEKQYVMLAKSKGFNMTTIFFRHILRNLMPSLFTHSKSIVLFLLSSMVIFELIFNIYGIITYILTYPKPNVIAFSLIMFYLPIFILYAIFTAIINKNTGQRLEW